MKKVVIIGAGAMGSAFAVPLIENKNNVTIVGTHLENELIDSIISNNQIHPTLKTKLPKEIKFGRFEKLQTILEKDLDIIVCGVSSVGIATFVNNYHQGYYRYGQSDGGRKDEWTVDGWGMNKDP